MALATRDPGGESVEGVQPQLPRPSVLCGQPLRLALGFTSGEAFRVAARQGRVPVRLFKIPGRQGWFALEADVAAWVRELAPGDGVKEGA